MNINKTELTTMIAEEKSFRKYEVKNMMDEIFGAITKALERGDRVTIRGFGTFEVKEVKGHPVVHPTTGERLTVGDFKNVVFRPGDELIRTVREAA